MYANQNANASSFLPPLERIIRKKYCTIFFCRCVFISISLPSSHSVYVERKSFFCRRRVGDFTCDGVTSQKKIDAPVLMATRWQIERRKIARIQARMVSCASVFFPFFSPSLSLCSRFFVSNEPKTLSYIVACH